MIREPFTMVVLIVLIVTVAGLIRAKLGIRRDNKGNEYFNNDAESRAMREEMRVLKERIAVLERITVEKENSLEREIEQLRDQRTG